MKDRLAQLKKLAAEGKVELGNEAAKKGGRSVVVTKSRRGLIFEWSRPGIGFGQLTLIIADGKLRTDREGMSVEFCLDVIRPALEEADEM